MNKCISEYVAQFETPGFFRPSDRAALEHIHIEVKNEIEIATETVTIEMDHELMFRAEKWFARIDWTLEEACILLLYRSITRPDGIKHG